MGGNTAHWIDQLEVQREVPKYFLVLSAYSYINMHH